MSGAFLIQNASGLILAARCLSWRGGSLTSRFLSDVNPAAAPVEAPKEIRPETGLERGVQNAVGGVEGGVAGGVAGGIVGGLEAAPPPPPPPPPPAAPVRVGGQIKPPVKTKDVRPVYPSIAQSARVQGVVIIEATIGPNGNVTDAKVLRSIPL